MNNAKVYKTFLHKLGFINGVIIYILKNDDKGELVCQTPEAEVITTKNTFSEREGNIYYNDVLFSITQGLGEENLKHMVNALNKAYQIGFSEGASMMLNK